MKKYIVIIWLLFTGVAGAQVPAIQQQPLLPLRRAPVQKYLSEKAWSQLFPHRYGIGLKDTVNGNPDFYSFRAFVSASRYFRGFLADSSDDLQKRELAAFLAQIASETSGGWAQAPGGYFRWGLYFLQEAPGSFAYIDTSKRNFPAFPGQQYMGRGPFQLSWNYNYGQFSLAWFGNRDSLLERPDLLERDPVLSFASAIWFWMTPQFPKPSCHDIMAGKWIPSSTDSSKGRLPGFGATVNVINGGVECGLGTDAEKTSYRYQYYLYFCRYFNVDPGDNLRCTNQTPFGR